MNLLVRPFFSKLLILCHPAGVREGMGSPGTACLPDRQGPAVQFQKIFIALVFFSLLGIFPGGTLAAPGLGLILGHDEQSGTESIRINLSTPWFKKQIVERTWYLDAEWEAEVDYWKADSGVTGSENLVGVGITPVFRLQHESASVRGFRPYLEGGLGIHILSKTQIEDKDLSTNLQFGSHAGLGIVFGNPRPLEIGYRFQHLSNASIKQPNPGINFHLIRFGYHF